MNPRREPRGGRSSLFDAIEEGGIRAAPSYSHEINEHENERALEGLQDRVILLKRVKYVKSLFEIHPDIATKFRIKNQYLKTGYMNVLLSLIETVRRSPKEISKADLDDAYVALETLTDYGFKLDWLKKNLDQVTEKKEKEEAGETRRKEIEEELKDLKLKCSGLEAHLEKVKRKCSDLEGQLLEQKAEVLAAIAPLSSSDDGVFDDFF